MPKSQHAFNEKLRKEAKLEKLRKKVKRKASLSSPPSPHKP